MDSASNTVSRVNSTVSASRASKTGGQEEQYRQQNWSEGQQGGLQYRQQQKRKDRRRGQGQY
jgi:hypothetical protein